MNSNKEEAREAMDIAERKLSENDYNGAKKFVDKAQNLYPNLDGLKQVMTMIDVYISASNKINGEADWYAVLGVDPLADDEAVKKQYKNLALLLHPDKNKFNGAEGAFKLVLQAWDLLSDTAQRFAYDQKRKSKQHNKNKSGMQKKRKAHEYKYKYYKNKYGYKYEYESDSSGSDSDPECEPDSSRKHEYSRKTEEVMTFWTMCDRCKTCQHLRSSYLNTTRSCPNCSQNFVATEVIFSTNNQSTSKSTSDASSSTTSVSDNANQAQEKESQEKVVGVRSLLKEMLTKPLYSFHQAQEKIVDVRSLLKEMLTKPLDPFHQNDTRK